MRVITPIVLSSAFGRLLTAYEVIKDRSSRVLKRFAWLRKSYAFLADRERYEYFAVTDWVNHGQAILAEQGFKRVIIEEANTWVELQNQLIIAYISEISGAGLDPNVYTSRYERSVTDCVVSAVPEDGVFFDIGANVGWFSLHVAQMRPSALTYAFEPGRFICRYLKKNVQRNGFFDRITIEPTALGRESGEAWFTSHEHGHALNHVVVGAERDHVVSVRVVTIDNYMHDHEIARLDVIKCDVEGMELMVMEGAEKAIRRFRPIVVLEINAAWTLRYKYKPEDIFNWFARLGYSHRRVRSDREAATWALPRHYGDGDNVFFTPGQSA